MIYAVLVIIVPMVLPTFSLSKPLEIEGIRQYSHISRQCTGFMERTSDCSFIIFQLCELGQVTSHLKDRFKEDIGTDLAMLL